MRIYHGLGEFNEEDFKSQNEIAVKLNQPKRMLQDSTSVPVDVFAVHGISLMICWGLLNFFGYCAARFLRHYKWWLYVHFACTILPAYWTFGMLIATLVASNIDY
jgi:hypothetical protein